MVNKLGKYLRSKCTSLLLLLLFVEYVGSVTLFVHGHIVDGETLYHSHIYSGSAEEPNHTHSSQQFKLITALSTFVALAAVVVFFQSNLIGRVITQHRGEERRAQGSVVSHFSLRAPPVVM